MCFGRSGGTGGTGTEFQDYPGRSKRPCGLGRSALQYGRTETLPIVADTPSLSPALGFQVYAEALVAAICGGSPPQFTVGIYGSWGSGKSSLLNAMKSQLESRSNVVPVTFDAWRYERAEHIVLPLLNSIGAAVPSLNDMDLTQKVRRALSSIARSLSFSVGPVSIDPAAALDAYADSDQYARKLEDTYLRPYAEMREIGEALGGRRIVVLVDDLDRCSPEKVVSLLEAINLVMDVPGFVFVLALDYDVLVKAVRVKYPYASGHVFIEKMVQVPFRVPRLEIIPESFLSELLPNWDEHMRGLPHDFPVIAYDVATLGLAANPRQVKRFINSLLVLLRIAENRAVTLSPRLLGGLVGLQLRWPEEYQDVANSVYAEDPSPLRALVNTDQPDLARYAHQMFDPKLVGEELRAVLLLTETVNEPQSVSDYQRAEDLGEPAQDLRASAVVDLLAALKRNGYTESNRVPMVFYHDRHPAHRVRIGKTVVRFEGRDPGGRWLLGLSLYLTRCRPEAFDLIDNNVALVARVNDGILENYGRDRVPRKS